MEESPASKGAGEGARPPASKAGGELPNTSTQRLGSGCIGTVVEFGQWLYWAVMLGGTTLVLALVAAHSSAVNRTVPGRKHSHASHARDMRAGMPWPLVRAEIDLILEVHPNMGPRFIRLAWHSSGTYDPVDTPHGGSNGATMRFPPEANYSDNRGLEPAISFLNPIYDQFEGEISHSDLWIFAAYVAVEGVGGPTIEFVPGRVDDAGTPCACPPEDRLPGWDLSEYDIRREFGRMGLNDRDIVALNGAHSVGTTHSEFTGFPDRNWDTTPFLLDNIYYTLMRTVPDGGVEWQQDWATDPDGHEVTFFRSYSWISLLTDQMLRDDDNFYSILMEYADSTEAFHRDFEIAFKKVTELGFVNGKPDPTCRNVDGRPSTLRGGCPFARKATAGDPKPVGHP